MKQILILTLWLISCPSYGASDGAPHKSTNWSNPTQILDACKLNSQNPIVVGCLIEEMMTNLAELDSTALDQLPTHYDAFRDFMLQGLSDQIKLQFGERLNTPRKRAAAFLAYYSVDLQVAMDAAKDAAKDAAWNAARDTGRAATWNVARDAAVDAARQAAWDAARRAARAKVDLIAPKLPEDSQIDEILITVANLTVLSWLASPKAQELRMAAYEAALAHVPVGVDENKRILRYTANLAREGNPYILALYRVFGISLPATP